MRRTGSVFPVLLVNFIGTLGFSIVIPFLVFLVTRFGGNAVVYGIVGATYPAFQLVGAPVLGRWSDRFGRRRILLLSQAGTALSWAVLLLALYLPLETVGSVSLPGLGVLTITLPLLVLFLARALDGLTGGNISVANAYLADVSSEADRARNFGRMGVSSNLGFVMGPALASVLGLISDDESLAVLAALAISVVATAVIAVALPESRPCEPGAHPSRDGIRRSLGQEPVDCTRVPDARREGLAAVLGQIGIPLGLALYFLVFLGFSFFYVSFPIRAAGDLGWTVTQTGMFFASMSLMMVCVQGPLLGWLSGRVPDAWLILGGGLLLGGNFLLLTSDRTPWIYGAAVLFSLGNGTMWPTVQASLSRKTSTRLQGATQGFAGAAGSMASIVGLLAGGVLYAQVGTVTFVIAAGLLVTAGLLGAFWARTGETAGP